MVLGLATVVWSLFIGWYLPDSPMKAKCFGEADKRLMFARVRANQTGIQNKHFKKHQLVEAMLDPFVWCCILLQTTSTLIIGGLGVFSNLIIQAFGFSVLQTQLLNIAQGAVTILVMVGGAMLAGRTGQTLVVMFVSLAQITSCPTAIDNKDKGLGSSSNCWNFNTHGHRSQLQECRRPPGCILLHAVYPG